MITGIGSLPFTDIDRAIDLIFTACPEVPFLPQLPKRSPLENMYTTFLEGVPSVVPDEEGENAYVDTERTEGIEEFYEHVAAGNTDAFALSPRVAPGFFRLLERIGEVRDRVRFIKGQITGPFSMGLGLKDEKGKPIIYNYAFFDIIKKALHMKARWLIAFIERSFPGKPVIIFFDEPYMVSFGSAYVSVSGEEAINCFNEVLDGLPATRGIHCCGNTDWSVLLRTNADIINYDAFNYLDTLFYYGDDLKHYLDRGGRIAPGFVPSSEEVMTVPLDRILGLHRSYLDHMGVLYPAGLSNEPIYTASCGLGSLSEAAALRAMDLLAEFGKAAGTTK